jgi:hypothetical protein
MWATFRSRFRAAEVPRPTSATLLRLATDALDRSGRKDARNRSRRPTVQGRPGPSATWVQVAVARGRIPANLRTASHSVIEKLWENARRAAELPADDNRVPAQRARNRRSVTVINVFLGRTYVGWVATLALAGPGTGGLALTPLPRQGPRRSLAPCGGRAARQCQRPRGKREPRASRRCGRPGNQTPSRGGGPDVSPSCACRRRRAIRRRRQPGRADTGPVVAGDPGSVGRRRWLRGGALSPVVCRADRPPGRSAGGAAR